jgi:hypothetical protein
MHDDEPSRHIYGDSIVVDTSHKLVELLITMMRFNKFVFDLSFVSYIKLYSKDFLFIILPIFVGWWNWTT